MTERISHVWSPFTQMKAALPVQQVRTGRGAVLELEDGRQILDWHFELVGDLARPRPARNRRGGG